MGKSIFKTCKTVDDLFWSKLVDNFRSKTIFVADYIHFSNRCGQGFIATTTTLVESLSYIKP